MNDSPVRTIRARTTTSGASRIPAPFTTISPRRARPPPLPVARIDTSGRWANNFQPMSFISASSSSESELDYGVDIPTSSSAYYSPTAATPVASSSISSTASSVFLRTPTSQDFVTGVEQRPDRWQARVDAELRTSIDRLKANIKAAQREMRATRRILEERRRRITAGSSQQTVVLPSFSADSVYTESVASSSSTFSQFSSVASPSSSSLEYPSYSTSSHESTNFISWR